MQRGVKDSAAYAGVPQHANMVIEELFHQSTSTMTTCGR